MSTGADPAAVDLAARTLGERADRLAPLGARTTYRVGGPAELLVVARSDADLALVGVAQRRSGLPLVVVGRGSNLLVADRGFPGIAVVLDPGEDAFGWVRIEGATVRAGAAVPLPTLARRCVDAGLTGFEWAVGVPGSVGGALRMNAGGHGSDMAASVLDATVVDLGVDPAPTPPGRRWGPGELDHRYRSSALGPTQVATAVTLALAPGDREAGARALRAIVGWRREHQPGGRNAGSVFTNPGGDRSAGALVEGCGWRGRRLGSAQVSPKHANFIQADDGGRADDVDALITAVADAVEAATSVRLRTEIRRIGFARPGAPEPEPQPQMEGHRP